VDGKMGFEGTRILQLFCGIKDTKTTDDGVIRIELLFKQGSFETSGGANLVGTENELASADLWERRRFHREGSGSDSTLPK
jgi:hypothetical protein